MPPTNRSPNEEPLPTAQQIDAVLAFLPLIEHPAEPLYRVDTDVSMLDPYVYGEVVSGLVDALYANRFVEPFDWRGWSATAKEYMDDPTRLDSADLGTLRKLLTTHARAERFSSGHLAMVINSGHLVAVLRRLAELRRQMGGSGPN